MNVCLLAAFHTATISFGDEFGTILCSSCCQLIHTKLMVHIWLILWSEGVLVVVEKNIRVAVKARSCNLILQFLILIPTSLDRRLNLGSKIVTWILLLLILLCNPFIMRPKFLLQQLRLITLSSVIKGHGQLFAC